MVVYQRLRWYNSDLAKITDIEPFLEGYEQSVLIPMKQVEWKHGTLTLMRRKFKLILSWDTTIHKSQGLALEMAIIYLGNSNKCPGMTLFALSHVKDLKRSFLSIFV